MAEPKKPRKPKAESVPAQAVVPVTPPVAEEPKKGLSIQVTVNKEHQFGGERLIVGVVLFQDGVAISEDEDYVKL